MVYFLFLCSGKRKKDFSESTELNVLVCKKWSLEFKEYFMNSLIIKMFYVFDKLSWLSPVMLTCFL